MASTEDSAMLSALKREVLTLGREAKHLLSEANRIGRNAGRIEKKAEECKNNFYQLRRILQSNDNNKKEEAKCDT